MDGFGRICYKNATSRRCSLHKTHLLNVQWNVLVDECSLTWTCLPAKPSYEHLPVTEETCFISLVYRYPVHPARSCNRGVSDCNGRCWTQRTERKTSIHSVSLRNATNVSEGQLNACPFIHPHTKCWSPIRCFLINYPQPRPRSVSTYAAK
jgi:hypothetical protein